MATRPAAAFPCPSTAPARIVAATLVAGTLDLIAAILIEGASGQGPQDVLQGIASAVLGSAAIGGGIVPDLVGLLLHYGIMAAMASLYVLASRRLPVLIAHPFAMGVAYGLALWVVMWWVVLPLRWNAVFPLLEPQRIPGEIFAHVFLVGLPIAYSAARRC